MVTAISRYGPRVIPNTMQVIEEVDARGQLIEGPHIEVNEATRPASLGVLTASQHCSEPQSWPTRCTGRSGLTARMTASRSAMSSVRA